ncbi:hypothetical protein D5S19_18120 [Amycolatopsis panacis]|uniref:Uncharacterized protein n=1 Tax=Amycolatopsis panacis TaxID=2340917 RepID=A0A419I2C8_9PSEU|nr:hypothetical protein D5S19_18120 [Amycolatopsis panacis]
MPPAAPRPLPATRPPGRRRTARASSPSVAPGSPGGGVTGGSAPPRPPRCVPTLVSPRPAGSGPLPGHPGGGKPTLDPTACVRFDAGLRGADGPTVVHL